MNFINRKKELNSLKHNYETYTKSNTTQVYIVEANHGIGKSEFIREVSKYFSYFPLDIFQTDNQEELSTFKRLVLELDKTSKENQYNDFKTFYSKKANNKKAIQLILKITSIFAQSLTTNSDGLIDNSVHYEEFILKAQTENLFEYAKYVFTKTCVHVVFHNASNIDSGSLDILSKLITTSNGSVFIFETENEKTSLKIEHYLQNNHKIFLQKYTLSKLSDEHMHTYIQHLLNELKLQTTSIDSDILKESIEKGDLEEISSILKDFNCRFKESTSTKLRSIKEILESLSDKQTILLILIFYVNGKLNFEDICEIMNDLNISFSISDLEYLLEKNLIEKHEDIVTLQSFVYDKLNVQTYRPTLKYVAASALIKNLNTKLNKSFNNQYVDILVEYYINSKQYCQLKPLLPAISQRLRNFNTQAERIDYFKKFSAIRKELFGYDENFAIMFAKIAYDANLYFDALDFVDMIKNINNDTIFLKAIILNRCEDFEESINYIKSNLNYMDSQSSIYFKLSLVLMMNLIQINKRDTAKKIFEELNHYTHETLYPYLIRLSNVFYNDMEMRLNVVKSISDRLYQTSDNEFSGLHAIYLAYLYALTQKRELAEESLLKARAFLGNNLIYNHMILHNEATIKFHSQEIDEEIPILLNNAKITAYDEYDQFAINNNLLVYFILTDKISSLQCQKIVFELEDMLEHTNFKRFVDKIFYNLYFYYVKMFNMEKSDYYKNKLIEAKFNYTGDYNYQLIYETSWKLPINI